MRQLSQTIVRLNLATRSYHAAVDDPWLSLVARDRPVDREEYIERLAIQYGFDAPLEAALAYTGGVAVYLDVHPRFRAGLIAQDLLAVGVKPAAMARLPQCMIAPFATVSEAFGWLYVHQRSTLLLEPVAREFVYLNPRFAGATSFVRSMEGRVGASWDDFGLVLDRVARTPEIEEAMVNGALDAFRLMGEWLARASTGLQLAMSS